MSEGNCQKQAGVLHLTDEEKERRLAMFDLCHWSEMRFKATDFGQWYIAQGHVDKAWEAIVGVRSNGLTRLADQELVFPNIMRGFNGH